MNKFKAFTLVEILLALAIVGIISAVTANQLRKMQVNKVFVSFKNCYSSMASTIRNLYDDEFNYPKISTGDYNSETGEMELLGFANHYYSSSSTSQPTRSSTKFSMLFMKDMLGSKATNNYVLDSSKHGIQFSAPNGSDCLVQVLYLDEPSDANQGYILIVFDANGKQEGPNCPVKMDFVNTGAGQRDESETSCTNPDRFRFYITKNGKILPDESKIYNGTDLETYMFDNNLIDNDK